MKLPALGVAVMSLSVVSWGSWETNGMEPTSSVSQTNVPQSVQSFTLPPGPFVVGFRTVELTDTSRIDDADPVLGEHPRAITAFVWYPASSTAGRDPVVYGDYVYLDALRMGRRAVTSNWKSVVAGMLLMAHQPGGLTQERLDRELISPTWAYRDAPEATGAFPLVLYGPGGASGAWDNSVLAEYLASYGYIVAAVSTRGWYSTDSGYPTGFVGSAAVAADLEHVLGALRAWPHTDAARIAAMGFSRGGITNVLMQTRDPSIRALIGLDGTIAYRYRYDPTPWSDQTTTPGSLAVTGFGQPDRIAVPFLWIGCHHPTEFLQKWGLDPYFMLWDELRYADAYRVTLTELQHVDFSSAEIRFEPAAAEIGPPRPQELKNRRYETIALYVRQFLDAYLRADPDARAFLERDPEANGLPPGAATLERRRPIGPAPTLTALRRLTSAHGLANAESLLPEILAADPTWTVSEPDLINWGWTLLAEGRCADAAGVMRLATVLHAKSANAWAVRGETELALGDRSGATASYRRALDADQNNPYARARLSDIDGPGPLRRLVECQAASGAGMQDD